MTNSKPTIITNDIFKRVREVSRNLKTGESITLKDGCIIINAEPKNRADVRRIAALRRKCEKPL